MAAGASRNPPLRITLRDQRLSPFKDIIADGGNCGRRKRRTLRGKIIRHLLQRRIGLIFEQVIHRRILAPLVSKRNELMKEIAGGLTREPREINIACPLPLRAMTRRAGQNSLSNRIPVLRPPKRCASKSPCEYCER